MWSSAIDTVVSIAVLFSARNGQLTSLTVYLEDGLCAHQTNGSNSLLSPSSISGGQHNYSFAGQRNFNCSSNGTSKNHNKKNGRPSCRSFTVSISLHPLLDDKSTATTPTESRLWPAHVYRWRIYRPKYTNEQKRQHHGIVWVSSSGGPYQSI